MPHILIVYFSRYGAIAKMAHLIARGVEQVTSIEARLRQVPAVSANSAASEPNLPTDGPPYASLDDLSECSGLILGSPTRFGNMSSALKYFLDTTGGLWQSGCLIGKPAGCFTSSSSIHGGQESTLISMMLPLLHHGALIVGSPYSDAELVISTTGGTPYGPSHFAGPDSNNPISDTEKTLCLSFGQRVAKIALKLTAADEHTS